VHPRWSGRAVTAVTEGHAEALRESGLADLCRWSRLAGRPDWTMHSLR